MFKPLNDDFLVQEFKELRVFYDEVNTVTNRVIGVQNDIGDWVKKLEKDWVNTHDEDIGIQLEDAYDEYEPICRAADEAIEARTVLKEALVSLNECMEKLKEFRNFTE